MQLQHQRLQRTVVPASTQRLRQLAAALVHPGVEILQGALQHPLLHHVGLLLVQHPEIRGQGVAVNGRQAVYILPQQGGAEGVHRLDVRLIDPEELAAEVGVVRLLRHTPGKLRGDLAPQLRRGGLGIGDDQEVVHLAALLLHIGKQALHQDLGFAGACGGGHQQASAPVIYGRFLLRRQRHGEPSSRLSSSTNFQNSPGSTLLMYRTRSPPRPSWNPQAAAKSQCWQARSWGPWATGSASMLPEPISRAIWCSRRST